MLAAWLRTRRAAVLRDVACAMRGHAFAGRQTGQKATAATPTRLQAAQLPRSLLAATPPARHAALLRSVRAAPRRAARRTPPPPRAARPLCVAAVSHAAPAEADAPYLAGLNPEQRHVVLSKPAALRVLAGPGSGKTRVLTCRVAHLIHTGVPATQILCLTFTNKAAREMKERMHALLGARARGVVAGTFHSVCVRLLRKHMAAVPGARQTAAFNVYDTEDAESLMRTVLEDMGLHGDKEGKKVFKESDFQARVSKAKNVLPHAYAASGGEAFAALVAKGAASARDPLQAQFKTAFEQYNAALARSNALDFDDLLSFTLAALSASPDLAGALAKQWPHVLVDEFQDTNLVQYELVSSLLRAGASSMLVVGDSDQSIYGWRGAEIELMRTRFTTDTGASSAPLAANYRSTPQICAAADAVLDGSPLRSELRVRPVQTTGAPVALWTAGCGAAEAELVADEIRRLIASGALRGADIAILYRAGWLSRSFERALLQRRIPYVVLGGLRFFARREIKDLTAYLRVIYNPRDEVAFRRIANLPARGISGKTLEKLGAWAAERGESVSAATLEGVGDEEADAPQALPLQGLGLSTAAVRGIALFRQLVDRWTRMARECTVESLLRAIVDDIGYEELLKREDDPKSERWRNVLELFSLAATPAEDAAPGAAMPVGPPALRAFLEDAALQADADDTRKDDPDRVRLMTMHGAKGLEFQAVFAVGLENDIIPSSRSLNESGSDDKYKQAYEEERRLCYVAVTRAKRHLYLTRAQGRRMYGGGELTEMAASPFLEAVEAALGDDKAMAVKREVPARRQSAGRPDDALAMDAPTPRRAAWGAEVADDNAEVNELDDEDDRRRTGGVTGAWDPRMRVTARSAPPTTQATRRAGPRLGVAAPQAQVHTGLRRPMPPPKLTPQPSPADAAARAAAAREDAAQMQAAMAARAAAAAARKNRSKRASADE